jgi:DNA-binding CsgD family transcriptional regulator
MQVEEHRVTQTIAGLYAASHDPDEWVPALDRLRRLFGGVASVVFMQDTQSGEVPLWLGYGTEGGDREYRDHIKDINPRMALSQGEAPGTLAWDARVLTEEQARGDPFYDWLAKFGLRYFIGARVAEIGRFSVFTSIERTAGQGHVEPEQIRLYAQILPHLREAFRLTLMTRDQSGLSAGRDAVIDYLGAAMVALGPDGRVIGANAAAERIFSAGAGLDLRRGRLRCLRASEQRGLDLALARVLTVPAAPPVTLALARTGGGVPWLVTVLPGLPDFWPSMAGARATVLIRDPKPRPGNAAALAALFGLTGREAALAAHLAAGLPLAQAAARAAMSHNTARVHLRGIFAKTGTRSQVELAHLLARLGPEPPERRLTRPD